MPRWPNSNDKPAIVYRAVNLINGKSYVGITTMGVSERSKVHFRDARRNKTKIGLQAAIRKYGAEMFRFFVVQRCASATDAKAEEKRLIALWHPEYNLTIGGDGCSGYRWTDEQREGLSKKASRYWLGKKLPEHVAIALRLSMRAKLHSPTSRVKAAAALRGRTRPAEVGLKISAAKKGTPPSAATQAAALKVIPALSMLKAKPVFVLPDAIVFRSPRDAAEHYGLKTTSISDAMSRNYTLFGLSFQKSEYFS